MHEVLEQCSADLQEAGCVCMHHLLGMHCKLDGRESDRLLARLAAAVAAAALRVSRSIAVASFCLVLIRPLSVDADVSPPNQSRAHETHLLRRLDPEGRRTSKRETTVACGCATTASPCRAVQCRRCPYKRQWARARTHHRRRDARSA